MQVGVINYSQSNDIILRCQDHDLDGNLTLDEPKTPKNAKLISNKAYQFQITSQSNGKAIEDIQKVITTGTLHGSSYMITQKLQL